jgi:hypothetical protein
VTLPPYVEDGVAIPQHTFMNVYTEMFLQVVMDYSGIGDFRELEYNEVVFFYEGLRKDLKEATKPQPGA